MNEHDLSYDGIAITGMAGRFPEAETVEELWANLIAGKESVSFFTDEELAESGLDATLLRSRGRYVAARGILKDADCFDAGFFGVHPKEAEVMDPQHRLLLEMSWTALERAGYAPSDLSGNVGIFAGATFNTYYQHALHHRQDLIDLIGPEMVMFGNEKDYLTTRVAYKLGFRGPAVSVSTACSTSLVAVAQACQALLTYQCDVALAGGSSVTVPQKRGYFHDEGNIGSADGHTRTFDAQASGTVFSNGVALVVLKRLADAVADGDQIYAVIKAAAVNNDGSQRVSFGAPGVEGQSEVIAMAHALAGVDPESISYVEAHGTATPLGDPIEVAGLTKAFRLGTQAKQFCALGSVKSNLGHLDVAAGVTGLIKTALSLHHRVIPASLHFGRANPKIGLEDTPFFVNATLREWKAKPGVPLRAGVSSFGTGGTNAHVVLEEAPELPVSGASRPRQLLVLSAKTPEALERATSNLAAYTRQLAEHAGEETSRELADAAFTLQIGRAEFIHRRIVTASSAAEAAAVLESRDPKRVFTHKQQLKEPPIVFMFPGQGAQYMGMGAQLYRSEPVFREEVDWCLKVLEPLLSVDLRTLVFGADGAEKSPGELLTQTQYTQPALFTIEYALAKLWMSWGIRPAAMIGHSVGEYVAGCLAEVFSLQEALTLVARRGALVQAQPGGAMLAVRLPESDVRPLLNGQMAIAAINSPSLCVVAGPHDAIADLEKDLGAREVVTRHLHTSHAFHSPMMEPVLAPFTELLSQVQFGEPKIPYVSNVTARWITPAEATSPRYWAGHVRETVRFAEGIAELLKDPRNVLLEVGPGQTLSTLARQHPSKGAEQIIFASLPPERDEEARGVLETLGRLWMAGAAVDWQAFFRNERRRRVVLPSYSFERKRFWPEPVSGGVQVPVVAPSAGEAAASRSLVVSPPAPAAVATLPAVAAAQPRIERLRAESRVLLQDLSGYDLSNVDPSTELLELGLDSLLLTQAATLFQRRFGIRITFRQLMEELSSIETIATYLDAQLPPEAVQPAVPKPAESVAPPVASGPMAPVLLEQLLQQQQLLTTQLLELMGRSSPMPALPAPRPTAIIAPPPSESKSHGPFRQVDRAAGNTLSPRQSRALEALIARYTRRTSGSKRIAAANRQRLADPRSVAGFKQAWKEMVYPIVTTRSEGSRVWDVDGNEYVDFVMGFGASLFGHRPPFVEEAVQEQLTQGFEIGPLHPLAGEVAGLIQELTGMERVAFTNTGSEAVLAATRVSRTVTGRDKIAVFAGAYHGIFDEVLFRPVTRGGEPGAAAIAPGIPESALGQVVVLEYGSPQALDYLRARGSEIAAVLVEPVQSRRLDLQPREFLHELRRVTEQTGSALIFDEVVTGFRVQPGGAQAYFGVRADLATYGKVIGGGLPIGVVTGSSAFMDALDGGKWQYGDASFPEVGVTFFAGTFVRHPLVLAAAKAVLTHLKEQGPELQERLTERTARLARDLQSALDDTQAPFHLTQFSSLMHLNYPSDQKLAGLLFYMLRERGIHIWDNRAFIMTTAHREEDFQQLTSALRDTLHEMQAGEFLLPPDPSSRPRQSPPLSAVENDTAFPLTDGQKEIWVAAHMGSDSAIAYNESLKLEFRGPFDIDLFRTAARQVVARHPILLARLSADGESQRLVPGRQLDLPLDDLTAAPLADRYAKLAAIIDNEAVEAFDLTTGPLLRVRMVKLSKEHHVVVWTAHHIVCDGWSGGLVVNELARIYSASRRGVTAELDAPIPFREYALDVQADTPESQDALEYWRQQFVELPAPLDLPIDHPRSLIRTTRASTLKRGIERSLHEALKRSAVQQKTTMVVLLMAAFKALIYRLTGQVDLVVGMPVSGQAVTDRHCLVGHCVNLIPIRTRLQPEASFQENVAAVRKSVLDGFERHQTTIGRLLQHLKAVRSPSRPTLVEVIFNVDRDPSSARFEGLEFACDRNPKRALHYDLFVNFVEGAEGLYLECDYNENLFDATTIERWLGHFEALLTGVVANPAQSISALPVLSEADRRRLTIEWNDTRAGLPPAQTVHEWFERQALRTPDAEAVSFENERLTYGQLNRRANQVAHHLRARGARPDMIVGLFLERSVDMVVGVLAVLKSGAAYLPLDVAYPHDRLRFMVEDSKAPIVLTQRRLGDEVPAHIGTSLCIEDLQTGPTDNPEPVAAAGNLVYVIYTSGSTGMPKGVAVEHHSVVNLINSIRANPGFTDRDVMLAVTTLSFDIATAELFLPLTSGGKLVIASREVAADGAQLAALLKQSKATFMQPTPITWQLLLEAGWEGSPDLKIISTGEPLPHELAARLVSKGAGLWNLYGPTETTIWSTGCQITAGERAISIGRPIANTQIYVLDARFEPVPIGVIGELYIGGEGLARGYLNRPDLTAEKFVRSPFAGSGSSSKLYRTGDLARLRADGTIECLGRIDHQVKLRGYRIELGEIEAVLSRHASVGQSAVVDRPSPQGEKMLIAYFETRGDSAPTTSDLRTHLRRSLPEHMVPSAFVSMNRLPLTPNGKIDRKALQSASEGRVEGHEGYVAPRDALELALAGVWAKALGVPRVGIYDNFFELGGHSLRAAVLLEEVRKVIGETLPLATLFRAASVSEFAALLREGGWHASWSSLVPIQPVGSRSPVFLVHGAEGNVLLYRSLAQHLGPDQPVYGLQARGLNGTGHLDTSVQEMASAYIKDIMTVQPRGPYHLGGYCMGGIIAFEMAQQLRQMGEQVEVVMMLETYNDASSSRATAHVLAPLHFLQNVWFHCANALSAPAKDQKKFLREKLDIGLTRLRMRYDALLNVFHRSAEKTSQAYPYLKVKRVNDRAALEYLPQPYDGRVAVMRPKGHFVGFASRTMGWEGFARGGVSVHEIPTFPKGMLVEPFAHHLAQAVRACMQGS